MNTSDQVPHVGKVNTYSHWVRVPFFLTFFVAIMAFIGIQALFTLFGSASPSGARMIYAGVLLLFMFLNTIAFIYGVIGFKKTSRTGRSMLVVCFIVQLASAAYLAFMFVMRDFSMDSYQLGPASLL